MELRHLRYFTAVVECKGYREHHGDAYAQPSISQAVLILEDEIGLKLFSTNRSQRTLRPEGEIFMRRRPFLQQAESAIVTAKRAPGQSWDAFHRVFGSANALFPA